MMGELWRSSGMVRILRLLAVLIPLWSGESAAAREARLWTYEGLVTHVDPELAPGLASGRVLSGSFVLAALEMEEDPDFRKSRSGRLTGGIREGELTIDHYYQLQFEALQATPVAGFDFLDNDPDADGRDLLGWFFPLEGVLSGTGWTSRWLQVWLADPEGRMIPVVPPPIPPHGFAWESGWFRLAFVNETGATAFIEGSLKIFGPVAEAAQESEAEAWAMVAADLATRLQERDRMLESVREELGRARERLEGMQRMLDLLVEERAHLQDDNERLNASLKLADPGQVGRVAELEAEKALLAQTLDLLQDEKAELENRLHRFAVESRTLRRELEAKAELAEAPVPAAGTEVEVSGDFGTGKMTLFEAPMIIERVLPEPVIPGRGETAPEPEGERAPPEPRRRPGPRKFR
ncbi:MAG TPA: hypothetical protein VJ960_09340 [Oceanipulchritudo sp.]|nr:hypothetical protein [Oceanipulchritudo sp.]